MKTNAYFATVKEWERLYGVPSRAMRFDPTEVRACCLKCGQMKPKMARHHKANDFFFALWFPHWYAKRYIEFRREDCAKLCDDCHHKIERYSERLKKELYEEYRKAKSHIFKTAKEAEEWWRAWCEEWRSRFVALFEKWIKQPHRKRKRKRKKRRSAAKREA